MKSRLIAYLKRQSFKPDLFSILINPFYFIRKALYEGIADQAPLLRGRLMDFGCGRKPYKSLFTVSEYIGVDILQTGHDHTLSDVDVYYEGNTLPFKNDEFDSIFCSEVLEHVFEPGKILPELYRTLKPGGKILVTVPFCWNEHEIPYDYARYSSFGIVHLLQREGFSILENQKTGNFAKVLVQLNVLYIFELFKKWGRPGYVLSLLIIAPFQLLAALLVKIFPVNRSLYFNSIILAEKKLDALHV